MLSSGLIIMNTDPLLECCLVAVHIWPLGTKGKLDSPEVLVYFPLAYGTGDDM
jgi:hypothetical protein